MQYSILVRTTDEGHINTDTMKWDCLSYNGKIDKLAFLRIFLMDQSMGHGTKLFVFKSYVTYPIFNIKYVYDLIFLAAFHL